MGYTPQPDVRHRRETLSVWGLLRLFLTQSSRGHARLRVRPDRRDGRQPGIASPAVTWRAAATLCVNPRPDRLCRHLRPGTTRCRRGHKRLCARESRACSERQERPGRTERPAVRDPYLVRSRIRPRSNTARAVRVRGRVHTSPESSAQHVPRRQRVTGHCATGWPRILRPSSRSSPVGETCR